MTGVLPHPGEDFSLQANAAPETAPTSSLDKMLRSLLRVLPHSKSDAKIEQDTFKDFFVSQGLCAEAASDSASQTLCKYLKNKGGQIVDFSMCYVVPQCSVLNATLADGEVLYKEFQSAMKDMPSVEQLAQFKKRASGEGVCERRQRPCKDHGFPRFTSLAGASNDGLLCHDTDFTCCRLSTPPEGV